MEVSKLIKKKRESLGLTQKEFSNLLGLGRYGDRTLRRWESGETKPSNLEIKAIKNISETKPFENQNIGKFKFIDLFAGIGGLRIPFQELGGYCVFSSEWDKFAKQTYRINFGEIPHGDITQIDEKYIPDFDILLAGFPCQPFSQAGLGKGFADTRGTLFFDINRIIKEKRPKAFLLENVKRLKGHDKGNTYKVIRENLEASGYIIYDDVLRAADFGLPQNRERIYIVGIRKDLLKNVEDYFKFPKPTYEKVKLGDILENKVDEKYTISDKLWEGHQRRKKEHKRKGNGFGYGLFNENSEYTNTLSARYYKDGSEILIEQKNKNPRKLTPRECARLQGFPEKFLIPVSDTQAYKQFGNSVPINVVREVAKNLIRYLEDIEAI